MKRYRVVNDCVGMPFNKRYFSKGDIIEVEDNVDPASANFELITENVPPAEKPKASSEAFSMKEAQDERRKQIDEAGGFASNAKEIQPDVDNTKSAAKKETPKSGKTKGNKTAG